MSGGLILTTASRLLVLAPTNRSYRPEHRPGSSIRTKVLSGLAVGLVLIGSAGAVFGFYGILNQATQENGESRHIEVC